LTARDAPGRSLGAAVLTLVFGVLGCYRDASSAPSGPPKDTVRVLARAHLSQAPLLIADEEGYFAEEGIELEIVSLTRSRDGLPSLVQGDLDVITSSVSTSYLNAIARGALVRIVADRGYLARDGCTYLALLARPELVRDGELLVPEPSSGRRLRVSVSRESHQELLAERALASVDLRLDSMELFRLSGSEEMQALAAGRLDLILAAGYPVHEVVESGRAVIWRTAQEVMPDAQHTVVLFGPSLLEDDPELGIRFMVAYLRGVRQYNEGKTPRNLDLLARRTGLDRGGLERACWIPMRDDGRIDVAGVRALQSWAVERGTLLRQLREDEFWEPRFVEEASDRLARRADAANAKEDR
jgi:NitT/TauT family transport system substrate-binding protein